MGGVGVERGLRKSNSIVNNYSREIDRVNKKDAVVENTSICGTMDIN